MSRLLPHAILLSVLIAFTFSAWQQGGMDFRTYYAAGQAVVHGVNPYPCQNLAQFLATATCDFPYLYPPHALLLFMPFALLPYQAARAAWLIFLSVCWLLAIKKKDTKKKKTLFWTEEEIAPTRPIWWKFLLKFIAE